MARGTGVAVVETAWRLLQSRAESFGHDGLCRGHAPTTGGCRATGLRPDRGHPRRHGPSQQRGRMHEQRTANAAIASPPHDPTNARSEAPLLELSPIPVWPPEKAVSVPSLGFGITHVRLLDTASIRPSRVDARTVNYSDSCVRQSRTVSPEAGGRRSPDATAG